MTNEDDLKKLFRAIMANCKKERKNKNKNTIRSLAKSLNTTENYLSAVESGREVPSFKLFLKYLLINGFDISALKELRISAASHSIAKKEQDKFALIDKIYSLNNKQLNFMAEQAKVAETIYSKQKKRK